MSGETICNSCLKELPTDGRDARHKITDLNLAIKLLEGFNVDSLEEIEQYQLVLNNAMELICSKIGVDSERYDQDMSDFACYAAFFQEVSEILDLMNISYDDDNGKFIIKERK